MLNILVNFEDVKINEQSVHLNQSIYKLVSQLLVIHLFLHYRTSHVLQPFPQLLPILRHWSQVPEPAPLPVPSQKRLNYLIPRSIETPICGQEVLQTTYATQVILQ